MKNAIYVPEILRQIENITQEDIKRIREASRNVNREIRNCLWCDKQVNMRADQKFCCSKCKTAYAMASARVRYDRLLIAQRDWELERDAFVKEIVELKKELNILHARFIDE